MFDDFRNYLKKQLPLEYPVRVHRVRMADDGDCAFRSTEDGMNGEFVIRINRDRSDCYQIDYLIHEYAHAVTGCTDSHGTVWGKAFSKCYKVFLDWVAEEDK